MLNQCHVCGLVLVALPQVCSNKQRRGEACSRLLWERGGGGGSGWRGREGGGGGEERGGGKSTNIIKKKRGVLQGHRKNPNINPLIIVSWLEAAAPLLFHCAALLLPLQTALFLSGDEIERYYICLCCQNKTTEKIRFNCVQTKQSFSLYPSTFMTVSWLTCLQYLY